VAFKLSRYLGCTIDDLIAKDEEPRYRALSFPNAKDLSDLDRAKVEGYIDGLIDASETR
jgi:hypothetical protein